MPKKDWHDRTNPTTRAWLKSVEAVIAAMDDPLTAVWFAEQFEEFAKQARARAARIYD